MDEGGILWAHSLQGYFFDGISAYFSCQEDSKKKKKNFKKIVKGR